MEKRCKTCRKTRAAAEFYQNKKTKDGLTIYCKQCMKESAKAYYGTERGNAAVKKAVQKKNDAGYYRYGYGAISILKQGAAKRGIDFDLTAESLDHWWHATPDVCTYCGISIADYLKLRDSLAVYDGDQYQIAKFRRFYRSPKHQAIRWMTIDRVNNEQGYSVANMVKCCWICNSLKGDFFSEKQMREIAPEIIGTLLKRLGMENVNLAINAE